MSKVNEISRESWILSTFPEWGTYLNEKIENKDVPAGSFSMWWLGCTGIWLKSHEGTNIVCDLWSGTGKQSHGNGKMKQGHQMMKMSGCENMQPNLRAQPFVLDPFAIKNLDALLVTHTHADHLDVTTAAAVYQNAPKGTPFIGPKEVVETWIKWGIPKERCVVIKPGDVVKIGSVEIVVLESFDRTALVTVPQGVTLKGEMPMEMDDISVNYLFKTSGGNLYHSGDSHYSNMYAKHGNEHEIDVALGSYGENPRGITDKMTSVDILRMAECLNTKVVIPIHHDIWTNFQADPREILMLWEFKKNRLQYQFKPYIWQVGGEFNFPQDKDKLEFQHYRGFDDAFKNEPDLPYPSFL